jgi:hypothetical protein
LAPDEQDEVLAEAVRQIELFVATFPPLRPLRDRLRPVAEMSVRTELDGGGLLLAGRVDLALSPPSGPLMNVWKAPPVRKSKARTSVTQGFGHHHCLRISGSCSRSRSTTSRALSPIG